MEGGSGKPKVIQMFLSEDLMEAGGAVKVEPLWIQGLACSNDAWIGEFVLEKANAFKFFAPNQDVGHAGKLFTLGLSQIRAVDDPVIVAAAVETILYARAVDDHLSCFILFSWDQVWFPVG